jgi:hypothetical protein
MSPVTTIVISDPDLLAKLASAEGQIVFEGPTGDQVKTVETVPFGLPPQGYVPPISDEEIERRRQQYRGGKPLSEIMKRLQGGKS